MDKKSNSEQDALELRPEYLRKLARIMKGKHLSHEEFEKEINR